MRLGAIEKGMLDGINVIKETGVGNNLIEYADSR
jgi:hypothetical protein